MDRTGPAMGFSIREVDQRVVRRTRLALLAAMIAATSSCGGAPKQAAEPAPPTTSTPEAQDMSEADQPAADPVPAASAPSQPDAPAEPPCSHDTSKEIQGSMGTIRIAGCLSPAGVTDSVKYKWRAVFECYQDARKADPKAKGTVEIRIGVGKKGVRSVQVPRSEIPSDEFIRCVIDTMRDAPMPKPEHDTALVIWTAKF